MRSLLLSCLILVVYLTQQVSTQAADENENTDAGNSFSFSRFRGGPNLFGAPPLPPLPPTPPSPPSLLTDEGPLSTPTVGNSSLIWQPLPLRATFRPLNRATSSSNDNNNNNEPVGVISERSISVDLSGNSDLLPTPPFSSRTFFPSRENAATTPSTTTTTTTTSSTTTPAPLLNFEPEDEQPTRQPMNRFRPRVSAAEIPADSFRGVETLGRDDNAERAAEANTDEFSAPINGPPPSPPTSSSLIATNNDTNSNLIGNECFECICEASTSCNAQSKCQTSDVRHTRCGMFLVSYDQWLSTNLSRELVSREAIARDPAADERAFYECVTNRQCAERLLRIFMQHHRKDCDKDGRIDCYDFAAVHHSGMDQCASETLLDSQYWSDFNACFGFGR